MLFLVLIISYLVGLAAIVIGIFAGINKGDYYVIFLAVLVGSSPGIGMIFYIFEYQPYAYACIILGLIFSLTIIRGGIGLLKRKSS